MRVRPFAVILLDCLPVASGEECRRALDLAVCVNDAGYGLLATLEVGYSQASRADAWARVRRLSDEFDVQAVFAAPEVDERFVAALAAQARLVVPAVS